jgi:FkbH-like protein
MKMKIALLGNYATQFFYKPLAKLLKEKFVDVELYHADFNSIDFELIDKNSKLYQFKPDYIIWHESTLQLRDSFYKTTLAERSDFANQYQARICGYLDTIDELLPNTKVLFPNHYLDFNDNVFGNYASKVSVSWNFQIQKINFLLNESSIRFSSFFLINSNTPIWKTEITDYALVTNAELHYTPEYLIWLCKSICQTLSALKGSFKKCIILDLDNTLWGGIIGDDGLEHIQIGSLGIGKAFTRLQYWLKELKNRGIILAVCSKNDEEVAKSPFLNHPEMILRLEDIAVFTANWNSKADNINQIQKILNIGFDSMVFLDDNPAEREVVRTYLPGVCVPELPIDPANYLPFLISENLFETISYSENDLGRTKQYQEEANRAQLAKSITNMDDYLSSLEMTAQISAFSVKEIERIAQLTQRSNQFNLRTIRYTQNEIAKIINDPNILTVSVQMEDKFGSYGLISVVVIYIVNDVANIDTWIMSCRVLKRNVEHTVMNYIVNELRKKNVRILKGSYISSGKNKLVQNLLSDLGMTNINLTDFELNLSEYINFKTHIKIK